MKKADMIELLKKIASNTRIVAECYDEGSAMHERNYGEYLGILHVITMLEDEKFAKEMQKIFC